MKLTLRTVSIIAKAKEKNALLLMGKNFATSTMLTVLMTATGAHTIVVNLLRSNFLFT